MATLVLSAVGAAVGGSVGGAVLGVSSAVIGKAIGATIGGVIDQAILGQGSQVVETGRVKQLRLQGAAEGAPIPTSFGRMRVAGQMIWSTKFKENIATTSTGGKGIGGPRVTTNAYTYSVSVAFALGEGPVQNVGRIWADGKEISPAKLNIRLYPGDDQQLPDPKIVAVEGAENTPAYRNTAYVVIEDFPLEPFGNRIPQMNFEVFRKAQVGNADIENPANDVAGVCLIPGTGEYALATTPVHFADEFANNRTANVNTMRGATDLVHALEDLNSDLPNCNATSLVVSWFGSDLRCGSCQLVPKVEQNDIDGTPMSWRVSGVNRESALSVSQLDNRPVFGGTPSDRSVLEAIAALKADNKAVMFYPFILMDVQNGNTRPDPWSDNAYQPTMPWRGRITSSKAAGVSGSVDKTAVAGTEVSSFFGDAVPSDFLGIDGEITFAGNAQWSYRRFILHYAHLCALAGGVDGFCIGSEMRGLTQIRDDAGEFVAVEELRLLTQDVRSILGADTKIGYAADWSEYFGYQPNDGSGDVLFHLDSLWADNEIDFIGIDNYMPLSDWRDELGHEDEGHGSIYSLSYLEQNIAGGEGYDWYYKNQSDRDGQVRTPITDGAYGEDWIFRYKDIKSWWSKDHYNRIGGVRQNSPTTWIPQSKPIYFTEIGCPAVDKGTNQPNVFLDPKSSESASPYYSSGTVDTFVQAQYFRAFYRFWARKENNPKSSKYSGFMVDMAHAFVWAWDARPWPDFPRRTNVWSDGVNHEKGHWITGRFKDQSLAAVVAEICQRSGFYDFDVSEVFGSTIGFLIENTQSARQSLQPLMMAFGIECFEADGKLVFKNRSERVETTVDIDDLVFQAGETGTATLTRLPIAELPKRIHLRYWDANEDYQVATSEAISSKTGVLATEGLDLPLAMKTADAQLLAEQWLFQSHIARDQLQLTLPPSEIGLTVGDVFRFQTDDIEAIYRIDRVEEAGARALEAVRVEQEVYKIRNAGSTLKVPAAVDVALPVYFRFLDLPLLPGKEDPMAPYLAATGTPWPGGAAVFVSNSDDGYQLNSVIKQKTILGKTMSSFFKTSPSRWSTGQSLDVRLASGVLTSRTEMEVLNGANAAVLKLPGASACEIIQFRDAELLSDGRYRLSKFIRGQMGTDAYIPDVWPLGTEFILLDQNLQQIKLSENERGLEKHYRIGPVTESYDGASYQHHVEAFWGNGLRPYAPAHLKVQTLVDDSKRFNWIRRTRINGDSWVLADVPLGEKYEKYHVIVKQGNVVLREAEVGASSWTYSLADQVLDGLLPNAEFEVAQVSESFGPGPYKGITF